jgi:tripartite-type tricarboxylate transporter receptor subunit TctC
LAKYPEKPISVIVPFGPGGGFDVLARSMASRLQNVIGQPVVINNKPGAGGRRGSITIFKSEPDGYTLGFAHFIPFYIDEFILGKKAPIDLKKLEIVKKIAHNHHFFLVNKESKFKTLEECKKATQSLKVSATGVSTPWLAANAVSMEVGFPISLVMGYSSMAPASMAVAKGEADATVAGYVQFQGVIEDLRPLVFLGKKRSGKLPDIPNVIELGYPDIALLGTPFVLVAPPGTPEDKISVIRQGLNKVVADIEYEKWLADKDYLLDPMDSEETWKSLSGLEDICKRLKKFTKK